MQVFPWQSIEGVEVKEVVLSGEARKVNGVMIRWLSRVDVDDDGSRVYGLRHFSVAPGAQIPMHNHVYHQTVYILSGEFECQRGAPESGDVSETRICGCGDVIYSPSMEPHAMINISSTEPATFLCCIATV